MHTIDRSTNLDANEARVPPSDLSDGVAQLVAEIQVRGRFPVVDCRHRYIPGGRVVNPGGTCRPRRFTGGIPAMPVS